MDKTRKAARQLASLIQGHMDEAGLSVAQREKNVRILEKPTIKSVSSRGKSVVRSGNSRARGVVVAR